MTKILFNGKLVNESSLNLEYNSDWARFSPGFFETMKVYHGQILFWEDHFERMKLGAKFWKVKLPGKKKLTHQLQKLIVKNGQKNARLRIQFNASLNNSNLDYLATTVPLDESDEFIWIEKGWKLGLYKDHYKAIEKNGFKANNRNIYLLAKKWAHQKGFDDALVMNTAKRVTDSTACSLFWVKKGKIYTTPVSEGGIDGTFSKFLKSQQKPWKIKISEKICTVHTLMDADEIFLTNVIRGIRWIKTFRGRNYENTISRQLFNQLKNWESQWK
ncbi:MAG: aminotransferase class IV [Bacteroidetes bacterium]|nr:aminotransferase class IV [Bacteroidota bacterium]